VQSSPFAGLQNRRYQDYCKGLICMGASHFTGDGSEAAFRDATALSDCDPRIPWWKGLSADSEEKREPVRDIDTAVAVSL